ncbi:hypothetical protein ACN4EK_17695 [Pantanalinema rosaneae CENA516]|uniref:hypothetical protein n=1 Tax=Pantanalinema rosaneae TaxID=1620701 RepID=UPI003D6F112F
MSYPSFPFSTLMKFLRPLYFSRGLAGFSIMAGLFAVTFPLDPAIANDFDSCTNRLVGLQIAPEAAADACSRALRPNDISDCVSRISRNSPIAAGAALEACRQVRRPVEMARCVLDVRGQVSTALDDTVLDYCRRSLLPDRYASCVTGVSRGAKIAAAPALEACIDAYDFPREVDPTFIPVSAIPQPVITPDPVTPPVVQPIPSPPPQTTTPTPPSGPAVPALW